MALVLVVLVGVESLVATLSQDVWNDCEFNIDFINEDMGCRDGKQVVSIM